jgi:hypothetical protein
MKRYWDTSALVDALHDSKLEAKILERDQWTRPHTLTEAFFLREWKMVLS